MVLIRCPLCTEPMQLGERLDEGATFTCSPCERNFKIVMITDPLCILCGGPCATGNVVCLPCFADNHLSETQGACDCCEQTPCVMANEDADLNGGPGSAT